MRANFFTFLPLPGTASYNELVQTGELAQVDWNNFLFMSAPYAPESISREELLALKRKAFLKFHLRPRIFLTNVLAIKSWNHFKFLLRRFYHWIVMKPKKSQIGEEDSSRFSLGDKTGDIQRAT